ncbi:hypothetical protein ODR06_26625, partial [Escherichia coli]|nr:hypothetical protein [Escherichia coli]
SIICSPMTSLKTSIKTITYLSDIGCLEIQGASLTYAGGKQWKGLMTRREIEREICLWGQQ